MASVSIDFETGDLSQLTYAVTDGGDLCADNMAALNGTTYGLKCTIDDTNVIYGEKNIAAPASYIHSEFWLDPNTLAMGVGDAFSMHRIRDATQALIIVQIADGAGVDPYDIRLRVRDDAGALSSTAWSGTEPVWDAP